MELSTVRIDKPAETNFILGQSHFIKTVEDLHEAIAQTVPQMKFGIAFCESSGPALVRWTGNDEELLDLAKENALALGCGHCFIIFMSSGFPINILNTIKARNHGWSDFGVLRDRQRAHGGETGQHDETGQD